MPASLLTFAPTQKKHHMFNRSICQALAAILIWSSVAAITMQLQSVAVLGLLTIIQSCAFVVACFYLGYHRNFKQITQPWTVWLTSYIGLVGNNLAYFYAFQYAPPLHIDLICWTWPFLFGLVLKFINKSPVPSRFFIGCLACLLSLAMMKPDITTIQHYPHFWIGCTLALVGSMAWVSYMFINYQYTTPVGWTGIIFGLGAITTGWLHYHYEPIMVISASQWLWLLVIGLGSASGAFMLWNQAIQDQKQTLRISMLAYLTPAISVLLLIVCQITPLTLQTLLATIGMTLALYLCHIKT